MSFHSNCNTIKKSNQNIIFKITRKLMGLDTNNDYYLKKYLVNLLLCMFFSFVACSCQKETRNYKLNYMFLTPVYKLILK